ncbi:MAG: hypothetical protein JWP97_5105 [Labilithrix sp.]|nr:hypothetical protein [Labilithrix sp.]
MSPGRLLGTAALALACVFARGAGEARADTPPSVWDRAKDPTLSDTYRIHLEVERRLAMQERLARFEISDSQLRTVRAFLERYNAAESKDARLRFDLAKVHALLQDYDKAAKLYTATLEAFPDDPTAESAWNELAQACGHLADHACERKAYAEVLRRETEDIHRAVPTLNLAETEMHFANLREAIDGYREALRLSGRVPQNDVGAMAVWGMAVALDRSGDSVTAAKEARFAVELERSMNRVGLLHSRGVFFTPAWEIHWYDGLGASASARTVTDPREALRLWRAAEQSFTSYVRFGEPASDRWVPLAKLRLAAIKTEREKAEKRVQREPPREADPQEGSFTF